MHRLPFVGQLSAVSAHVLAVTHVDVSFTTTLQSGQGFPFFWFYLTPFICYTLRLYCHCTLDAVNGDERMATQLSVQPS